MNIAVVSVSLLNKMADIVSVEMTFFEILSVIILMRLHYYLMDNLNRFCVVENLSLIHI